MKYHPILALIHITNECNLTCKHCYARKGNCYIDFVTFKDMLDQLQNLGTKMLHLSGGELFLNPDVFKIIEEVCSRNLYMEITTNGTLLNEDILKELYKYNISKVVISFDGATNTTHDFIRGTGNYEKSLKNLKMGINIGLQMAVNFTVMKQNFDEIDNFIDIFSKFDLKFINFRRFIPTGELNKHFVIASHEYLELFRKIYNYRKIDKRIALGGEPHKNLFEARLFEKAKRLRDGGCSAGRYFISIDPNGDIMPCGFLPIVVGNIYRSEIEDVWKNSDVLLKLRERKNLQSKCGNCSSNFLCGGCRADAYANSGNYLETDTLCWRK